MNYDTLKIVISKFQGRDLALEIFRHSLINQQRAMFDLIPLGKEYAISGYELASMLGISSKNCSSQLRQLMAKCSKIKSYKINKKTNRYYI